MMMCKADEDKSKPYLSFDATTERNSKFECLKPEQFEELKVLEIRSMGILLIVIATCEQQVSPRAFETLRTSEWLRNLIPRMLLQIYRACCCWVLYSLRPTLPRGPSTLPTSKEKTKSTQLGLSSTVSLVRQNKPILMDLLSLFAGSPSLKSLLYSLSQLCSLFNEVKDGSHCSFSCGLS